ncbi:rho GDP-dissociation inhibitor 1-like [Sycon ciliatum]|uniref:rho GDP-dissociation inhibitor 1-like n=1 Tax=Sycon ciliatum TaxID=27933 RepID=UPI0020AA09CA|eukprot:scpid85893/ scgid33308/ Rho GDP-dissociation inhibitor 1; Rho-GDI alpha &gt; Rho GDP-dissociation inhibitor 1; Rho-GDI alpha
MASEEDPTVAAAAGGEEDELQTPGYKAPAKKSLDEIQKLDQDDESLVKYKKMLLGEAANAEMLDEGGSNVIVKSITLVVADRDDITLDLTGDTSQLKSSPFTVKEGCSYRLRITFRVQREIVTGLVYSHATYRKGIKVDTEGFMLGSYGPRKEVHTYMTPVDEAPSGLIARGKYVMKSKFCDDDKHVYLAWEWGLDIKKDW